jgi:very-short-patch-repair endonuclease
LLALGLSSRGIEHRIARGRLHLVARGVYAVGRLALSEHGRWMAAVLACGGDLDAAGGVRVGGRPCSHVALSHGSAAALFGIGLEEAGRIEISTPSSNDRRVPGVRFYRRQRLKPGWLVIHDGIPVTSPVQTLIDLAARHDQRTVERFVNEADRLRLVRTDVLRKALADHPGERGVDRLRTILDRRTFRYTRTELERAFIPIATSVGLPLPHTSVYIDGHEVDFYFPTINLVIETDGLTYHRTPSQQAKDLERDQDHEAAGTHSLRFSHAQIKYEPERVRRVLAATASLLTAPESAAIIPS